MLQKSLSNLQVEILKLYSTDMSEEELKELKEILAHNYSQKAINEANSIWDERHLSDSDMENWLNGN